MILCVRSCGNFLTGKYECIHVLVMDVCLYICIYVHVELFTFYGARQLSGRMLDSQPIEPGFESRFATVSKVGHFRSLH